MNMIATPLRLAALLAVSLCSPASDAIDLGVTGNVRVPVVSLKESRFLMTVRQQYDFSCGSAAVATLLSYHYGRPVSEQTVFEQMFAKGDQKKIRQQGFSLLDMQRFLAGRGFRADGFELPLEKLVEAKLPAIVLLSDKGYHHFVVIKGVAGGRILVGDPSSGARSITVQRFQEMWINKLLFVIHGYPGTVGFNLDADWRAAPRAPLADGIPRGGLDLVTLPKHGPGDF